MLLPIVSLYTILHSLLSGADLRGNDTSKLMTVSCVKSEKAQCPTCTGLHACFWQGKTKIGN